MSASDPTNIFGPPLDKYVLIDLAFGKENANHSHWNDEADILADMAIAGGALINGDPANLDPILRTVARALAGDPDLPSRLELRFKNAGRRKGPTDWYGSLLRDYEVWHFVNTETASHGSRESAVASACEKRCLSRSAVFKSMRRVDSELKKSFPGLQSHEIWAIFKDRNSLA